MDLLHPRNVIAGDARYDQIPKNWIAFAGLDAALGFEIPEPALPPADMRYTAFHLTAPDDVRVVILGQDPYPNPGEADGLAFSVQDGIRPPRSLQNIYKELASDLGVAPPKTGNLTDWARQGVLLLNSILTVEPGKPRSHRCIGWEVVTDAVIRALGQSTQPRFFILWGNDAQFKRKLINTDIHGVHHSVHPSPLSARRGFFGSAPFSRANAWLTSKQLAPVDWVPPKNRTRTRY